jgi:hypothetical protein
VGLEHSRFPLKNLSLQGQRGTWASLGAGVGDIAVVEAM